MSTRRYQEITSWLFQQFPSYQLLGQKAYKPTLENTRLLLDRVGNPEKSLKFVHVAGSNGKGSVCSMLASILCENGLKTGLFTSPHIVDYRERIRVNGHCIDELSVVDFVDAITQQDWNVEPSFFEISFAMALYHFRASGCEICVIETGLGGRLDATNVISPLATAITSISLEHTQILGNTLTEIAREKGGIIKNEVPLVLGEVPEEASRVLEEIAATHQAKVYKNDASKAHPYALPLLGHHQQGNFQIVLQLLEVLDNHFTLDAAHIQDGLDRLNTNTGFIGRLQVISRNPYTLYDVSHNAEGLYASLRAVRELSLGRLHIVYATSSDKDLDQILPCFHADDLLYLCEFSNPRSMKLDDLVEKVSIAHLQIAGTFQRGPEALRAATSSCLKEDVVLVTGSFFLLSDFF